MDIENVEISFLSWNIKNNKECLLPLQEILTAYGIDVLLLNESSLNDQSIGSSESTVFTRVGTNHQKAKFYTRLPPTELFLLNDTESKYINFCGLEKGNVRVLVGGLHLPSKRYKDRDTQASDASDFVEEVRRQSTLFASDEVLLFGDFNMSPFEVGMTHPRGFNNVMDKVSVRRKRTLNGRPYDRFYNPTFALLGDFVQHAGTFRPAGSYFTENLKSVNEINWNMLDNVLLKGKIVERFCTDSIQFITATTSHQLLEPERNRIRFSDHLPLAFKIKIG